MTFSCGPLPCQSFTLQLGPFYLSPVSDPWGALFKASRPLVPPHSGLVWSLSTLVLLTSCPPQLAVPRGRKPQSPGAGPHHTGSSTSSLPLQLELPRISGLQYASTVPYVRTSRIGIGNRKHRVIRQSGHLSFRKLTAAMASPTGIQY